jgi:hypothetical protein
VPKLTFHVPSPKIGILWPSASFTTGIFAGDIFQTAASSALSLFDELAQRTSVGQMRQIRLLADLKYSVSPTGFLSIRFGEHDDVILDGGVCVHRLFAHRKYKNARTHTPCSLSGGFLLVFDMPDIKFENFFIKKHWASRHRINNLFYFIFISYAGILYAKILSVRLYGDLWQLC